MKVSKLAENIIGSEIIKLAAEVNEKIRNGTHVYNFTIGDFDPHVFPIPSELKELIRQEYGNDETNYPAADGMLELRTAVSKLLKEKGGLDYPATEILIAGGARPLIYSIYKTLVDPGDHVFFATPSWNNNHYTYLNGAVPVIAETTSAQNFMPSAEDIAPHISKLTLIALCSPQNPTGTVFTAEGLTKICDLILDENKKRAGKTKPLYLMYDQIYWALTFGDVKHFDPVSLRPAMKEYTIYVDGISKSLAATGVRLGWSMGPKMIIDKMKAVLTHVGAWAPRAEQLATAGYLNESKKYDAFLKVQKEKIYQRLKAIYDGIISLKEQGHLIDAVNPQAAIYLTVQFNLLGKKKDSGEILNSTQAVTKYLLDEARLAIVPFSAFGSSESSNWYRLSVGTCKMEDIPKVLDLLKQALCKLS